MKTLNLDLFTNADDVTEDEFCKLVKANNYEVYDQKGILAFLRRMNGLLEKSIKEDLSKEELSQLQKAQNDLKSLKRKTILTKAGTKYERFIKAATNGLEKKYANYTFAEIDKKMKELSNAIKDKETRSKERWGTPESKQLDKEILELEDELNKWKRYGHHFEKKDKVEKGKKAQVGEVSVWTDGTKMQKQSDGSWKPVTGEKKYGGMKKEKEKKYEVFVPSLPYHDVRKDAKAGGRVFKYKTKNRIEAAKMVMEKLGLKAYPKTAHIKDSEGKYYEIWIGGSKIDVSKLKE